MAGTLYLCATPIGNLQDMTPRVVETLRAVDVIAAEDTRNSVKLLNHFDIHTPMTSYHEYNKVEKARQLVGRLLAGEDVALITDAGTVRMHRGADPVRAAHQEILLRGLPAQGEEGAAGRPGGAGGRAPHHGPL